MPVMKFKFGTIEVNKHSMADFSGKFLHFGQHRACYNLWQCSCDYHILQTLNSSDRSSLCTVGSTIYTRKSDT